MSRIYWEIKSYSIIIILGVLLFGVFLWWNTTLGVTQSRAINKSTANVAFILIGLSYLVRPLSMKWNYFLSFLHYRKYLGITGLGFALFHGAYTFLNVPAQFLYPEFDGLFFGVLALLIFSILGLVSNSYSIKRLGEIRWRYIQNWGYYGFLFAYTHLFIKSWDETQAWLPQWYSLPPQSLLVILFGAFVFLLRSYVFAFRDIRKHKFEKKPKA